MRAIFTAEKGKNMMNSKSVHAEWAFTWIFVSDTICLLFYFYFIFVGEKFKSNILPSVQYLNHKLFYS